MDILIELWIRVLKKSNVPDLSIVEILVGVWQAAELSQAAVQVDVARPEDGKETHLRLPCVRWGDMKIDLAPLHN